MGKSILAAAAVAAILAPTLARAAAPLGPVDYAFIGQTYLGNRFQVDTGKLGETHAGDPAVRAYAKEMDVTHVQVEDKLVAILKRKGLVQPPTSLLKGAYDTLVRMLDGLRGPTFDRAYIQGQVSYQHNNDALYRWEIQNGADPDLKAFAKEVVVKIDDHMHKAEKLAASIH